MATDKDADLAPVAPGLNVTLSVQVPLAATVAGSVPQLFVSANAPGFVPPIVIPVIVKGPEPVLDSVTALAVLVLPTGSLPNASELGNRLADGGVPVPESGTVCDVAGFATLMFKFADLSVVALGMKLT
jgi:hypothetical protein